MAELETSFADAAPAKEAVTPYDRKRLPAYLRLLDAAAEGADWREVARLVLKRDPATDPAAEHCHDSHLARARWFSERGFLATLQQGD